MASSIINFCIGVCILLISTNIFVSYSEKFSALFKLSPLIIGITVVSIGTSLPEFTLSLIAALKGDTGLALGNIIGSNIVNIFLVLPIALAFGKLRIGTTKTQRSALLLLASTILYAALYFSDYPPLLSTFLLLMGAAAVTLAEYVWAYQGRSKEDKKHFLQTKRISIHPLMMLILLSSIIGIISGGVITVFAVEEFSKYIGISTTILGLSVTAIATSLPEVFATIISQEKEDEKMTTGNIIGSNIYNLLLVGGTIFLFTKSTVINQTEWLFLFGATAVFTSILFVYSGKTVPKIIGPILFSFFVLYILSLHFGL